MRTAFVVQGLFHKSDSVGYDCVHQYLDFLRNSYSPGDVSIFAETFGRKIYDDIPILGMDEFYKLCDGDEKVLIVYHYCDGWPEIDKYIMSTRHTVVLRWHNNTPPWFYIKDNPKSAERTVYGFEQLVHFLTKERIFLWCNSEFSQRQLEALGAPESRIAVVYPASRYLTKAAAANAPRRREGAFKKSIRVLFVSRVAEHKGHKHVIATAALAQRMLDIPVSVEFAGRLGNNSFIERLVSLGRDLGISMRLHGEVSEEELLVLYRTSDVFVCLSEHEGFGMPIFEAMRCGIPVVAWACTALQDLLDGHSLSFTKFNIKDFANAITSLADDDIRERVLSEQKTVLAKYTAEIVSEQIMAATAKTLTREKSELRDRDTNNLLNDNYIFDSHQNLVSLYDIQNYRFFLQLQKRGEPWLPAMSVGPAGLRFRKGIRSRPGKCGHMVFGPYFSLPPGKYRLTAQLKIERGMQGILSLLRPHFKPSVRCEVVVGERCLVQRHLSASSMLKWPKILEFVVEEELAGIEFHIWTAGKLALRLRSVEVELVGREPLL
jgi:glycosyltransferase involved in cell wall biosynthesis